MAGRTQSTVTVAIAMVAPMIADILYRRRCIIERPESIDPGVVITTIGMSARPASVADSLCTTWK